MDSEEQKSHKEVCVVTVGSVDSGKSTFIGACISGQTDDGKGYLRNLVAKHAHEKESGKTSDISIRTIKHDYDKELVMVDLCGHEKYLKTTIFGLTGYFPDYGVLIVAANRGMLKMTREHLGLLLYLKIPLMILITREDIAPQSIYNKTVDHIKRLLKKTKVLRFINYTHTDTLLNNYNRIEFLIDAECKDLSETLRSQLKKSVKNILDNNLSLETDLQSSYKNKIIEIVNTVLKEYEHSKQSELLDITDQMSNNDFLTPVLTISNKTGYFLNFAKNFLFNLQSRKTTWSCNDPSTFYIDASFSPQGVGLVVSGTLRGNTILVNDTVYIGPYQNTFVKAKVKSIHGNNRQDTTCLSNAHKGCLALRIIDKVELTRNNIKKGWMVIKDPTLLNNICYQFTANIQILHHPTTIKHGFVSVVHCNTVRQAAIIRDINKNEVRDKVDNEDDSIDDNIINDNVNADDNEDDGIDDNITNDNVDNNVNAGDNVDKTINKDVKINTNLNYLRVGDKAYVTFRFTKIPEYMELGSNIVFREGNTKGIGTVTSILPISYDSEGQISTIRKRYHRQRYKKHRSNNNSVNNSI